MGTLAAQWKFLENSLVISTVSSNSSNNWQVLALCVPGSGCGAFNLPTPRPMMATANNNRPKIWECFRHFHLVRLLLAPCRWAQTDNKGRRVNDQVDYSLTWENSRPQSDSRRRFLFISFLVTAMVHSDWLNTNHFRKNIQIEFDSSPAPVCRICP